MRIKSNLFEIMQFCLLQFILLFAYLSVLLTPHFLQSDQYSWFSHAQLLMSGFTEMVPTVGRERGEGRYISNRYTVTTRMISVLRWAAM